MVILSWCPIISQNFPQLHEWTLQIWVGRFVLYRTLRVLGNIQPSNAAGGYNISHYVTKTAGPLFRTALTLRYVRYVTSNSITTICVCVCVCACVRLSLSLSLSLSPFSFFSSSSSSSYSSVRPLPFLPFPSLPFSAFFNKFHGIFITFEAVIKVMFATTR